MSTPITDEMIECFLTEHFHGNHAKSLIEDWNNFKSSASQSKQVEGKAKDWIVEVIKSEHGSLISDPRHLLEFMHGNRPGWAIHSVKRLSDGEAFALGDLVASGGKSKKIIGFEINESWTSGLFATIEFGGQVDLFLLTKAPEVKEPEYTPPPIGIMPEWLWKEQRFKDLDDAIARYSEVNKKCPEEWLTEHFALKNEIQQREENKKKHPVLTTEDGFLKYKGDHVFDVDTKSTAWIVTNWYDLPYPLRLNGAGGLLKDISGYKYFHSKEKAEEYILMNKPCLSYREVVDIVHKVADGAKGHDNKSYIRNELYELAQSKLQKP